MHQSEEAVDWSRRYKANQDRQPHEQTRFVMRGDMTGLLYDVPVE
jgi:hypothetical protein